jgi:hypothetical protein
VRLIVQGYSNERIAATLYIPVETVSAHVSHILGNLGVASRMEAAALAIARDSCADPSRARASRPSAQRQDRRQWWRRAAHAVNFVSTTS